MTNSSQAKPSTTVRFLSHSIKYCAQFQKELVNRYVGEFKTTDAQEAVLKKARRDWDVFDVAEYPHGSTVYIKSESLASLVALFKGSGMTLSNKTDNADVILTETFTRPIRQPIDWGI